MITTAETIQIFYMAFKHQLHKPDNTEYTVRHYEYLSLYGEDLDTTKDPFVYLDIPIINLSGIDDGIEGWFSINHIDDFFHDFNIFYPSSPFPHFSLKQHISNCRLSSKIRMIIEYRQNRE